MGRQLISHKTLQRFRDYFGSTSLSTIDDAFAVAGLRCGAEIDPYASGRRKRRVGQYYDLLNLGLYADVKRLLAVYEHVLDELEDQIRRGNDHLRLKRDDLVSCLERDGFSWKAGRLVPPQVLEGVRDIQAAVAGLDAPELARQLDRLRDSIDSDPGLAIGTAKEMLETTCKTILEDLQVSIDSSWDVAALLKETRKQLNLLPEDVPEAAKGAETIRRVLSNLGQLGVGLSELRNLYGSGHGRSGNAKGLSERHARLAVGAVATLVQFLFETHRERKAR